MNKHSFTQDENSIIYRCACGVTRKTVQGKKFYTDTNGQVTYSCPNCTRYIKAFEPKQETEPIKAIPMGNETGGWSAHEGKKIECIAFISSVYDSLFKDREFPMASTKNDLKNRAETILVSNGVAI